jgi:hypothetical protein
VLKASRLKFTTFTEAPFYKPIINNTLKAVPIFERKRKKNTFLSLIQKAPAATIFKS